MKQATKALSAYGEEVVRKLGAKYNFEVLEALAYIKGEENALVEEKRGRPAKGEKKVKTKEQTVDAAIMAVLDDAHETLETAVDGSMGAMTEGELPEKGEVKTKKKKSETQEKGEAKAKKEAEKQEKAEATTKKKESEPPAKAETKTKKKEVGGFAFKEQPAEKPVAIEEEEEDEGEEYELFEFGGTNYYRTPDNVVFDTKTSVQLGVWNEETKCIDFDKEDEDDDE